MTAQLEFEVRASGIGWLLGRLGVVWVANMGEGLTDESFAQYLRALDADFVRRASEPPLTIFYDTVAPLQMTSTRRRALADVLERHREVRARTTSAFALTTPSALGVTVMNVVFWLSPPPYPTRITKTQLAAFRYLAEMDARIEPERYVEAWTRATREIALPR